MNEQLQPLKKQTREGKSTRSGTQDDVVYAHIFDAILEQRLAPGTKLSEEALGEIFGVSRTIIRRALSRLAHEGVVLLRPNRGAVVASPSVEEARQVFLARRLVERAITELAVQHATAEQIAELRQMVNDERDSFSRGDRGAGIRLSGEFHLKLARSLNNPVLLDWFQKLISRASLYAAALDDAVLDRKIVAVGDRTLAGQAHAPPGGLVRPTGFQVIAMQPVQPLQQLEEVVLVRFAKQLVG